LSEEKHCLQFEAFYAETLEIGTTTNIFSISQSKQLYLVEGSTGPTWNIIRVPLPTDAIFSDNRCRNLYISAHISQDTNFTEIPAAFRNISIEKGNCLGTTHSIYTGMLPKNESSLKGLYKPGKRVK
jgi:hypothetical protein